MPRMYPAEFRLRAVALVRAGGKTITPANGPKKTAGRRRAINTPAIASRSGFRAIRQH
jgi:hypothetical protein